jgi:cellobiose phosphorylase
MVQSWKFCNSNGDFELNHPDRTSHLYFPLMNKAGIFSAISPNLNGDIKTGQHTFLTQPVSVEDLHNTRSARNFWLQIVDKGAWSVTGNSARQLTQKFCGDDGDQIVLKAGFLWHQIIIENQQLGIRAETLNFVPYSNDQIEIMRIRVTNSGEDPITFTPTAAIPMFCRSAENLRDHRHVTSLLHRISCNQYGVQVCPTLSFDERGHHPNQMTYGVFGFDEGGNTPIGFFPLIGDFIGEGGTLDWPEAIVCPSQESKKAGTSFHGYEALGGLQFSDKSLLPGESYQYYLILAIMDQNIDSKELLKKYGNSEHIELWLNKTEAHWNNTLDEFEVHSGDETFDLWLRWVELQPILRKHLGNSFLPYHDYGKGGRGWRDLWQDILSSLIMKPQDEAKLLLENFAGIRLDGSNATIIGSQPGEFKADRNNIPRVWMDHGAWPFLTTQLYIHQTGDLSFLLKEQVYFKDHLTRRAQSLDQEWAPEHGTQQLTRSGEIYHGTVLEHLLIQHLTSFFNVGAHNHIKLEGADWNDGMDMAVQGGESVAFTALYAANLYQLSDLIHEIEKTGIEYIELASELQALLDTIFSPVDYQNIKYKQQRLEEYFSSVQHKLTGQKIQIKSLDLVKDLSAKARFLSENIRINEWISDHDGQGWFNGYYDNDQQRLEGEFASGVRMTLTGQVFTLMGGIADPEQTQEIIKSVDYYLFDANVGGYRLNTDFNEVLLNMGRCFGFSYGDKENGAMFSHMAVMYAYALYERGFAREAYKVLSHIYSQSINFNVSRMYPGIPEYFNSRGRGLYPYLTGSASWYLFTLLTQAYGVKGHLGDLMISPNLVKEQFDETGKTSVNCWFADRNFCIEYRNPDHCDFLNYTIQSVQIDEQAVFDNILRESYTIPRKQLKDLERDKVHNIIVYLAEREENLV